MFSKATAKFLRQIDPDGSFINVSRVNDSCKLVPMALVVKCNRVWFWQKPKYQPADFLLSDLLLGDEVLKPGVSEKDFLMNFKGNYGNQTSGMMKAEGGNVNVALEGSRASKLQMCFDQLKIEELDVPNLWNNSKKSLVDMQHMLVQQLEKQAEVLAVVKERILTTSSCSISMTKKDQGLLELLGSSSIVTLKNSSKIEMDHDISMEIPSGTVIAYSILELKIKKDGHFTICLQPHNPGGFEDDSLLWHSDVNLSDDGAQDLPEKGPLCALLKGFQEVDLRPLAELPESSRQAFIEKLREILKDRADLTSLQFVLEELCTSETEDWKKSSQPVSDQHSGTSHGVSARLNAAHLLVSAMEELPDEALALLSTSSYEDLKALDMLMCSLKDSSEPLSVHTLPILLQDSQRFQLAEGLFGSAKVTISRGDGRVWTETGRHAGVLPLVLCLSIHGLSLLCSGLK